MNCEFCQRPIAPSDQTCRQVTGWERKAKGSARRGGSDVLLREPTGQVAHLYCVNLSKSRISPQQGMLA